jgi:hypothetical protein
MDTFKAKNSTKARTESPQLPPVGKLRRHLIALIWGCCILKLDLIRKKQQINLFNKLSLISNSSGR